MNTELLPFSEQSAKKAAEIMAAGGVVGIPTETVYRSEEHTSELQSR